MRKFLAVAGSRETLQSLERYLYGYARVYESVENTAGIVAVCVVEADTEDRLNYVAEYQAGRLQSGLWFARVFDTFAEAKADKDFLYSAERFGLTSLLGS